ncbi:MAG: hypothetical protein ACO39X_04995 [Candidatus Nanopelagicaceae bacterium]
MNWSTPRGVRPGAVGSFTTQGARKTLTIIGFIQRVLLGWIGIALFFLIMAAFV